MPKLLAREYAAVLVSLLLVAGFAYHWAVTF
jgi:hypothetical protein